MAFILDIWSSDVRWRVPFTGRLVNIGRSSANDVVLPDDRASRQHARIQFTGSDFILHDLQSRNGTFRNGEPVTGSTPLVAGDTIRIGRHQIALVGGDARASVAADDADVLTADDLVEVADVELDTIDEGPQDVIPASMFASDDATVEVQLAELASNLPNHGFDADQIVLTDASGQPVHGGGNKKGGQSRGEAVELLRLLLLVCYRARATDLHVEPRQDGHFIRLRIDGVMVDIARVPSTAGTRLATVVKVLCQVDIAQRKSIQEGAFAAMVPDVNQAGKARRLDYRVSFAPAVMGQKLVVRILDAAAAPAKLGDLNMPRTMMERVARVLKRDSGMILVAGPTGSGKTTTLYSLLRSIDLAKMNVVTIEDPVEVHLDGITQIPVDEAHDRSFIQLLRSVLRQDPDVILVGEVRDSETARVALQAAITGHLVFSTVHTRDTIGTIFRLRDLGVEPYMLGQGLQLVVAQRLVRQLCVHCKRPVDPTPRQRQILGPAHAGVQKIYKPVGCPRCLQTGHAGRRAFFEMLTNSEELSQAIYGNPSRGDILKIVSSNGFVSLRDSAYELVAEGHVAFDEVDNDQDDA